MMLFTHDVKKIKVTAHKNGDIDGMSKRGLRKVNPFVLIHSANQFRSNQNIMWNISLETWLHKNKS